jgi:MFS transporter, PPP family, 3-phenylpropionic acid transporter
VRVLLLPKVRSSSNWGIIGFFVFAFAAGGVIQPFLMLYLKEVGLSGAQIGILQGWTALISVLVTPFIGLIADRTQRHRVLLGVIVFVKGISAPLMLLSSAWVWLVSMVSIRIITAGAQDALMNRLTLTHIKGNGRSNFGSVRFWGALSFAITSLMAGIAARNQSVSVMFPLAGILALIAVLFVAAFPSRIVPASQAHTTKYRARFRLNPALLSLFAVIFLFTVSRSGYETFGYVFLSTKLNAGNDLIGLLGAMGGLAPIPAYYLADWMLKQWGQVRTMAAGLGFFGIGFAGFGLLTNPWFALPLVISIGIGTALFLVSLVVMLGEIGLPEQAATDQMLAQLTVPGLAGIFALPLSGLVFDSLGGRVLFGLEAAMVLMTIGFLIFYSKRLQAVREAG